MKAKESIIDSRESMDLSPTNTEAVIQGTASTPENKRRRLVRGAVAAAPLVLTLRSGALAAATSCTPARLVKLPANGKFSPGSTTEKCLEDPIPKVCAGESILPGTTTRITTQPVTLVDVEDAGTGPGGVSLYRCGSLNNKTVAILSSQSITSLNGG